MSQNSNSSSDHDKERQIVNLNKKIVDLEEENKTLLQSIERVKTEREYIASLEEKIAEFSDKISSLKNNSELLHNKIKELKNEPNSTITSLKEKIVSLNKTIYDLEEKNKALKEKYDSSTLEQSTSPNLENNVVRLQKRVAELEAENKNLSEKNQMLKAALLLHVDVESKHITPEANVMEDERIISIPKGIVQQRIQARHAVMEGSEYEDETTPTIMETKTEKIEQPPIEPKISTPSNDEISKANEPTEIHEAIEEPLKTSELSPTEVHEIEPEQKQENLILESSIERRKCPKCGNANKMLIREIVDKTKIISPLAGLYGKKFICGQCGAEWR